MSNTLKIAYRSPMPLPIEVVTRNADGSIASVDTIILRGASNEAGFPEGITEGVNADAFNAWMEANQDHPSVEGGLIRVIGEDEPDVEFGFEAGLAAAAEDTENVKLAEQGSTITDPAPVSSEDMAATSDTPNDDSPRSDVNTGLETPTPQAAETDLEGSDASAAEQQESAGEIASEAPTATPELDPVPAPAPAEDIVPVAEPVADPAPAVSQEAAEAPVESAAEPVAPIVADPVPVEAPAADQAAEESK